MHLMVRGKLSNLFAGFRKSTCDPFVVGSTGEVEMQLFSLLEGIGSSARGG